MSGGETLSQTKLRGRKPSSKFHLNMSEIRSTPNVPVDKVLTKLDHAMGLPSTQIPSFNPI